MQPGNYRCLLHRKADKLLVLYFSNHSVPKHVLATLYLITSQVIWKTVKNHWLIKFLDAQKVVECHVMIWKGQLQRLSTNFF